MDDNFPEQLKCPVCLGIPSMGIFQCRNGHILCHLCIQSLVICPQCRGHLGIEKIRSRALEDLLDLKKFDCNYKGKGCNERIFRKDLPKHLETCSFGGEIVLFCQHLGYKCDYIFNTRKTKEGIEHLREKHELVSSSRRLVEITLKNFKTTDSMTTGPWKPIILSALDSTMILVPRLHCHGISFSCILVEIETNKSLQVKFTIASKSKLAPALEWTTKPIPITKSEVMLQDAPFFVASTLLKKYYLEQEKLVLSVFISDENAGTGCVSLNKFVVETSRDLQFHGQVSFAWDTSSKRPNLIQCGPIQFGPNVNAIRVMASLKNPHEYVRFPIGADILTAHSNWPAVQIKRVVQREPVNNHDNQSQTIAAAHTSSSSF